MARETWKWDGIEHELVTSDELSRRRSERKRDMSAAHLFAKPPERGSWVYDREACELVPASEYYSRQPARARGPMIISDDLKSGVNGLWHPATGSRTDSKSEFRRMTRDSGCVEIGDDRAAERRADHGSAGADINAAIESLGGWHG